MMIRLLLMTFAVAAAVVTPVMAIMVLARCGRKALGWSLALVVVIAGMAWFARGVKECRWRSEQGLHIRWNVDWFSNQYQRICKLGDDNLQHDYVTNFCCNACTLLNLACKTAPNTSNLVERYYNDWNERIETAERSKEGVR